jgi:hypothetical protein
MNELPEQSFEVLFDDSIKRREEILTEMHKNINTQDVICGEKPTAPIRVRYWFGCGDIVYTEYCCDGEHMSWEGGDIDPMGDFFNHYEGKI